MRKSARFAEPKKHWAWKMVGPALFVASMFAVFAAFYLGRVKGQQDKIFEPTIRKVETAEPKKEERIEQAKLVEATIIPETIESKIEPTPPRSVEVIDNVEEAKQEAKQLLLQILNTNPRQTSWSPTSFEQKAIQEMNDAIDGKFTDGLPDWIRNEKAKKFIEELQNTKEKLLQSWDQQKTLDPETSKRMKEGLATLIQRTRDISKKGNLEAVVYFRIICMIPNLRCVIERRRAFLANERKFGRLERSENEMVESIKKKIKEKWPSLSSPPVDQYSSSLFIYADESHPTLIADTQADWLATRTFRQRSEIGRGNDDGLPDEREIKFFGFEKVIEKVEVDARLIQEGEKAKADTKKAEERLIRETKAINQRLEKRAKTEVPAHISAIQQLWMKASEAEERQSWDVARSLWQEAMDQTQDINERLAILAHIRKCKEAGEEMNKLITPNREEMEADAKRALRKVEPVEPPKEEVVEPPKSDPNGPKIFTLKDGRIIIGKMTDKTAKVVNYRKKEIIYGFILKPDGQTEMVNKDEIFQVKDSTVAIPEEANALRAGTALKTEAPRQTRNLAQEDREEEAKKIQNRVRLLRTIISEQEEKLNKLDVWRGQQSQANQEQVQMEYQKNKTKIETAIMEAKRELRKYDW